jgi:hypothetical protein
MRELDFQDFVANQHRTMYEDCVYQVSTSLSQPIFRFLKRRITTFCPKIVYFGGYHGNGTKFFENVSFFIQA